MSFYAAYYSIRLYKNRLYKNKSEHRIQVSQWNPFCLSKMGSTNSESINLYFSGFPVSKTSFNKSGIFQ